MKITILCRRFGGSSEAWLHRQVMGFIDAQVFVLTLKRENETQYPDGPASVFEIPRRADRNILARGFRKLYRIARGSRFNDIRWIQSNYIKDALFAQSPDVILIHYGTFAMQMLPLIGPTSVPIVVHFHGYDISQALKNDRYVATLLASIPKLAAIVVVANYQKDWLLTNGVPERKVSVIPCGVPLKEFSSLPTPPANHCRFLMVGRLVRKKRPDLSLRAFAKCLGKYPQSQLSIIGDGEMHEECRRLAVSLGIDDRIEWLGFLSNEQVRANMKSSSIFVQHSMTGEDGDKEGWPVSISEAMAAGLPVVSTRHAGIVDQVIDGETGYLVNEGDWNTMGDLMIDLAANPLLRQNMGARGRQHIEQFDAAIQISSLQTILAKAVV